jgi:nonsense-mediated mRNA decay protein 3
MREAGDRDAFLSEITTVPGGIDIKISSTKIGERVARKIITEFGGSYSTSETLVTEDSDGNEVYRVNFAIRLPAFVPGDIINPPDDNGPVVVENAQTDLKGTRLITGNPFEMPASSDLSSVERVGSVDDEQSTTLVTVEDEYAIQILDPDTYQPITIPNPTFLYETSGTISVIKVQQGVFPVPND